MASQISSVSTPIQQRSYRDKLNEDALQTIWFHQLREKVIVRAVTRAEDARVPPQGADVKSIRAFLNNSINESIVNEVKGVDLRSLDLLVFPTDLKQFKGIEWILLNHNQLTQVPTSDNLPPNLTFLSLYKNPLTQVPSFPDRPELQVVYGPVKSE
jgi:hypothetical protein